MQMKFQIPVKFQALMTVRAMVSFAVMSNDLTTLKWTKAKVYVKKKKMPFCSSSPTDWDNRNFWSWRQQWKWSSVRRSPDRRLELKLPIFWQMDTHINTFFFLLIGKTVFRKIEPHQTAGKFIRRQSSDELHSNVALNQSNPEPIQSPVLQVEDVSGKIPLFYILQIQKWSI